MNIFNERVDKDCRALKRGLGMISKSPMRYIGRVCKAVIVIILGLLAWLLVIGFVLTTIIGFVSFLLLLLGAIPDPAAQGKFEMMAWAAIPAFTALFVSFRYTHLTKFLNR